MSQCPVADLDLSKWKLPVAAICIVASVITWYPELWTRAVSFSEDMDFVSVFLYFLIALFIFLCIGALALLYFPDDDGKDGIKTKGDDTPTASQT